MTLMRRVFLSLICLLVVLGSQFGAALSNPAFSSPLTSVAPPDAKSPFGVAGAMRWPDWGSFDRPADAMLQTGGAWTREDFVWGLIEPREGQFQWTATDRIVAALQQRGINMLGIVSYSVNWATPSRADDSAASPVSFYAPDLAKYAAFVKTLVSRYKESVHYWEIWNEPNSETFWKPAPNPNEYAAILKTAYRAVKEADPTAKVLTGGMSGNAVPFLEQVLSAGAGDSFDILAIHPYAVPLDQDQGRTQSRPDVHRVVSVELGKYHAFLQRHDYNRPLWVTEIGWPAGDWQLNDQLQADYLAQAYAQMLASGLVERIFWYSFKDEAARPDRSWGLVGWGGGQTDLAPRRPSFSAYATSAQMLSGATPKGSVQLGDYTILDSFDAPETWNRSVSPNGEFSISNEQKRSGTSSARFRYTFDGPNQAVDFAPPQPVTLPGTPSSIGVWARGDASGNYLSAWLRDRDGELFKVLLGSVTGADDGWRFYSASINSYYFSWEHSGGNPSNGAVDYPVSFVAFRLENTPDEPAGSGTIYLDDLRSTEGPDISVQRFSRQDGQVVDVIWSATATQVKFPTSSTSAQLVDRDGTSKQVSAASGSITLEVSERPQYLLHSPSDTAKQIYAGAATPQQNSPNAACIAMKRADPFPGADNRYIAETGHNLRGSFRTYWESHDGLRLLGYPITEEFLAPSSDGKPYVQQYFQRARMEYHPESQPPNDVMLGLLGVWTTDNRSFARVAALSVDPLSSYFPETGHNLAMFKNWWAMHGGLTVFGYPLSEELQETNPTDGKTYAVQYFERNRLEYHPEYKSTDNEVLLGLLGAEFLAKQGCK